jgi:hypothetical protein
MLSVEDDDFSEEIDARKTAPRGASHTKLIATSN